MWHGRYTYINKNWRGRLQDAGVGTDNEWSAGPNCEHVSGSEFSDCYRLSLSDGDKIYVKTYDYSQQRRLRYFLRPSRAACEAYGFSRLKALGIPSLKVVALFEHRTFGFLRSATVITEAVDNSIDLAKYAEQEWYFLPRNEQRHIYESLRDKLIESLQQIHRHHFFHRDLFWRNILLVRKQDQMELVWIDCPRARYLPLRARHEQMVDLSCLARYGLIFLTRGARYRFLQQYLGLGRGHPRLRRLFRAIESHHRRSKNPPRMLKLPTKTD